MRQSDRGLWIGFGAASVFIVAVFISLLFVALGSSKSDTQIAGEANTACYGHGGVHQMSSANGYFVVCTDGLVRSLAG
jgi:hypothetical protein